jgi:hypothetical protein
MELHQTFCLQMSSFKFTITLESDFNTQELADFFTALAHSERGNGQPLFRILHPETPPPTPAPMRSGSVDTTLLPTTPAPTATPAPTLATVPPTRNIQWQHCNITLVAEDQVDTLYRQILNCEIVSPSPSIHWNGPKHSPRAQHNQRILNALRNAANRTLSYQMIASQAGIPELDKLKSYLRELEKQGFITVARVR